MNYGVIQMDKGNYQVADEYFERALTVHAALRLPARQPRRPEGALGQPAKPSATSAKPRRTTRQSGELHVLRALAEIEGPHRRGAPAGGAGAELSPADAEAQALPPISTADPVRRIMDGAKPPATADGWLELSSDELMAHRYEDCIRSSEHALGLRPAYAEAFNNICAALNALGNTLPRSMPASTRLQLKPATRSRGTIWRSRKPGRQEPLRPRSSLRQFPLRSLRSPLFLLILWTDEVR